MGTVFGKNTTSASITVAGHKTYYIDSTDAEIVEVEKQGGDGSTASDDATGTISGVTLPTEHSYTGVSFDSLRYYVKGTLSNTGSEYAYYFGMVKTWYKGTITWTDETLGDLSDRIVVNPPGDSIGNKQTTFKIIFIDETPTGGTHAYDTGDSPNSSFGYVTDYTYSNGVHSITYWYPDFPWYVKSYSGRIQFRYLNGVTTFNNLSAFDLINVSGGSLSKATTTDRYAMYNAWNGNITLHALYGSAETIRHNAFKYLLSGTPYWYVIDGEHDTWTDDLSAWGYSEVPVGPVLPEVVLVGDSTQDYWLYPSSSLSGSVTIAANGTHELYQSSGTFPGRSSYPQAMIVYQSTTGTNAGYTGFEPAEVQYGGINVYGCKNISGGSLTLARIKIAKCYSSSATVITVYNSSNVAYNAFKFTANNTDYYYVLDGTQTDWTDDLAGIGYSLNPVVVTAYFTSNGASATSNTTINPGSGASTFYILYDASGGTISKDSSKTYTFYKAYRYDGTEEGFSAPPEIGGNYWYLTFHVPGNGWSSSAYRVEYTVS